ncbi:hypothetical protein L288_00475 [Sphingobium quisquiliarum P25]|uniref:Uncharacterized protein n=1 Tax=Sphingobium quisquiliarum P25 TaxID=1329909 RepID=T0HSD3_9SPHN|nr:hypothetical protein L288_00475 [Sphingobium quisquiliarum P25]
MAQPCMAWPDKSDVLADICLTEIDIQQRRVGPKGRPERSDLVSCCRKPNTESWDKTAVLESA